MEIVRARRNGGEISHFRRAETTSFRRPNLPNIDVPRKFPKPFHEYATIKRRVKVRKIRKMCKQQLHNADLGLSVWPLFLACAARSGTRQWRKVRGPLLGPLLSPRPPPQVCTRRLTATTMRFEIACLTCMCAGCENMPPPYENSGLYNSKIALNT